MKNKLISAHYELINNKNYRNSIFDDSVLKMNDANTCATHTMDILKTVNIKAKGFRPIHIYNSVKPFDIKSYTIKGK